MQKMVDLLYTAVLVKKKKKWKLLFINFIFKVLLP